MIHESNTEENNKPQQISTIEIEENFQFKRGLRIFRNINVSLFVFLSLAFSESDTGMLGHFVNNNSFLDKLGRGLGLGYFYLFLIQFVYLIPTVIFCLVKKKYAFMKGASIVLGITMLLFPVTCFGTLFLPSLITK